MRAEEARKIVNEVKDAANVDQTPQIYAAVKAAANKGLNSIQLQMRLTSKTEAKLHADGYSFRYIDKENSDAWDIWNKLAYGTPFYMGYNKTYKKTGYGPWKEVTAEPIVVISW